MLQQHTDIIQIDCKNMTEEIFAFSYACALNEG